MDNLYLGCINVQKSAEVTRRIVIEVARPTGLEPVTPRFVVWYSIQLSYGRMAALSQPK